MAVPAFLCPHCGKYSNAENHCEPPTWIREVEAVAEEMEMWRYYEPSSIAVVPNWAVRLRAAVKGAE